MTDRNGIELLNRPRHTQGCRVNRRRSRRTRTRRNKQKVRHTIKRTKLRNFVKIKYVKLMP